MADELTPEQRRSAMTISIWEGMFAQFHGSLVGSMVLTFYVRDLGASYIHYALLSAIPPFTLLVQLLSARWLQYMHRRKPFTVITAYVSRFAWLPIAIIPFFFVHSRALTIFFLFFAGLNLSVAMAGNSWLSWMVDTVPPAIRGRYFSRRNMLCTIIGYSGSLAVLSLDYLPSLDKQLLHWFSFLAPNFMAPAETTSFISYGIIDVIAVLAGALPGLILLIKQPEPPFVKFHKPAPKAAETNSSLPVDNMGETELVGKPSGKISFVAALKQIPKMPNFRTFLLVMIVWSIVNGFSAPFWNPFQVIELNMSHKALAMYGFLGSTFSIISFMIWGKLIDRFGSKTVCLLVLYVTAFHPLLYVVSNPRFTALMYVDAISSGLLWNGFGIAVFTLQLASTPKYGREMFFAIYAAATGLAVTIPQFIAGWAVDAVGSRTFLSLSAMQIIFWLVSIGRFLCLLWFMKKVVDPKEKPVFQLVSYLATQVKETFIGLPRFFIQSKEDENGNGAGNGNHQ